MRRKPLKTSIVALILMGIYVLGLLFGIWLVSYLLSHSKRPGMLFVTNNMVTEYMEHGQVDPSPIAGLAAIVYDSMGRSTDFFRADGRPIHFDFVARGERYLPRVLDGKEALRLVLFAKDDTTLGYTSLVYVGVPLTTDGEITGALFWVRELQDLLETILGYICVFTIMFATVSIFMALNLRNQRRYDQMRRQYIDNITHELKTPVASIKALAEALSDGMEKSPTDRNVYYGMIIREANRQERMICDVLELSKLQSFRVEMSRQAVCASEIFAPVCEKYASYCDLMGINFTVSDEIQTLPELYTDPRHISVVLDVLLNNATKFVSEDGEIRLSAKVARRKATICIADNGKGISREELPHVFERFYKGNRSDNEVGSGLGLAIAKETMENLNEKIWIQSEEGTGTEAYFTVSLKP